MSYIVPKSLIFEYARKLSPNAVLIFILLLDDHLIPYESCSNYYAPSYSELSYMTGIHYRNIGRYIKELKELNLIEDNIIFTADRHQNCQIPYEVRKKIYEKGYLYVPLEYLQELGIKSQVKVLYILQLILSENSGNSFAGRKYLGEVLGIDKSTVTRLNSELAYSGLLDVNSTTSVINGKIRTFNKYIPLIYEDEAIEL